MPTKDCTIAPIDVNVDSKTIKTNAIDIKVKPYKASKDDDFILTYTSDKKEVYIGEPFSLTLLLKQRKDAQALDSKFEAPKFKGFWIKNETKPKRYQDATHNITKVIYTMAAQRAGKQQITPAKLQIATRSNMQNSWGSWTNSVKWKSYFSNKLMIKVKDLPQNLQIVGDFTLDIALNKKTLNANEALNITLTLKGDGNLEDVKSFKPDIDGVSVFAEKIEIKGNTLTQKLAFVGDKDFKIPSFKLKYFDLKTKSIKILSTKAVDIKVNAPKIDKLVIKKDQTQNKKNGIENKVIVQDGISSLNALFIFMAGIFMGITLFYFKDLKFLQKEQKISLKDPKKLLVKLMPHKEDEEVKKIIDTLEANLYAGKNQEVDKKLVKKCIQRYGIK
jgi:hypothetical protein